MTDARKPVSPTIYGTGLIALDLVISAEPDRPVSAWTGGTCGNVLCILAYLGWNAFPIARLNGDVASQRVQADMKRWGVRLDFAACAPTCNTPIVIQSIRRNVDGFPQHRFSWACPNCGKWLPPFKAVTKKAVEAVSSRMSTPTVFFMDRLSRAALTLATTAAERGALVVFEPSARSDPRLLNEALQVAHVVKYADQRKAEINGTMDIGSSILIEVQTLGMKGLRFRQRLEGTATDWEHMPAVTAPKLADTCGSGDWCTAGLLAKIGRNGRNGLMALDTSRLRDALRYGQALAAWNCGFEGARGGMYGIDRATFVAEIDDVLTGRKGDAKSKRSKKSSKPAVIPCPACPT